MDDGRVAGCLSHQSPICHEAISLGLAGIPGCLPPHHPPSHALRQPVPAKHIWLGGQPTGSGPSCAPRGAPGQAASFVGCGFPQRTRGLHVCS